MVFFALLCDITSVPNKLGGIILLLFAIWCCYCCLIYQLKQLKLILSLLAKNVVLIIYMVSCRIRWLGGKPVEQPFLFLSQTLRYYIFYIF